MEFKISIRLNEKLFLRDPESSDLGRRIVKNGADLISELGFEGFTFKKLAEAIQTTEASVYRYFESKHKLLLYIITWYWTCLEYQVIFSINNMTDSEAKIRLIIDLLSRELDGALGTLDFDKKSLYNIVISESNKAYLSKDVDENNSAQLFKPYKDLCNRIAVLFLEYNPSYPYAHSLASTVIESVHLQYFFAQHLPRLTNVKGKEDHETARDFLAHLVFSALKNN
jgi:AcrR family transcriptional regulator